MKTDIILLATSIALIIISIVLAGTEHFYASMYVNMAAAVLVIIYGLKAQIETYKNNNK